MHSPHLLVETPKPSRARFHLVAQQFVRKKASSDTPAHASPGSPHSRAQRKSCHSNVHSKIFRRARRALKQKSKLPKP